MSSVNFMSMRWLRLHIKEIIWATVTLFVGSIFVIGYGTSRQIQQQEERQKKADQTAQRADDLRNTIPGHLQDKLTLPVVHVSYPAENASLTTVIDVKQVWRAIKDSPEYQQLETMPEGIRDFYGKMIKDRALENLISMSLIELYARANKIVPQITAQALIEQDRQQISPVEFDRQLRKGGLSVQEYGEDRLKQLTFQTVAAKVVAPVAPASATEDFLKNYYQSNLDRFKLDDQISFDHLLISSADFAGKAEISDEQIKNYFDANRGKFVSSKRLQVSHIMIKPQDAGYLETITASDAEIRRRYTDNLSRFKDAEKVQARHILIKPANTFDRELPDFKANLRNFTANEMEDKTLFTFDVGLANLQSSTELAYQNFVLVTADGNNLSPDSDSMSKAENALELPFTGSTKAAVFGKIGIFAAKGSEPATLIIRDGEKSVTIDIAAAFDPDKAFAAAEAESRKILAQAEAGEDFAKLAETNSQDAGSAQKGGDLGEFSRGAMVKEFEDAAFTTGVGKITGPIKSQFGYHIIKVENKIPEKVRSLEDVRNELAAEIKAEQAELKAITTLETLKHKIYNQSEDFATLAKTNTMGSSRKDGGKLPVFFNGEITDDYSAEQKKILLEEIGENGAVAKEIADALFNLDKGELSEVIKTSDALHLFRVDDILEPIQLSLTTGLKAQIHEILEKEKQEELAKAEAEKLKTNNPSANVQALANLVKKKDKEAKTNFGPLPISANPGFSSYSISDGTGNFSSDGRTYLPEIHKTIMKLIADGNWKNKVAGPFASELGFHFIEIKSYEGNRVETYEELKGKLRQITTHEPADEDVQKEFEATKDKYDVAATRKIRQIVVVEEKSATDLYDRLTKGEIFALLANKYSIDGSSGRGGLLAPLKRGQLSANLDKAVWDLEKGQFTQPIKTPYGFVIAQLEDNETPGVKASLTADVITQLKKKLRADYQAESWEYFMKGLNNKAYVIRHPEILAEI